MSKRTSLRAASAYAIEQLESRLFLSVTTNEAAFTTAAAVGGISPAVASTSETTLSTIPSVVTSTGEKPQDKAWFFGGNWWSVISTSTGTHIFRLDGTSWTQTLTISPDAAVQADVKAQGDVTHILMESGGNLSLVSVEFVAGSPNTYQLWSARPTTVAIPGALNTETATIEIDINGRMWVAYDGTSSIFVRSSTGNYSTWSAATVLAGNVTSDDVATITRVGDYGIGVFWSNHNDNLFHFRYHSYLDATNVWGGDEFPGAGGALNVGDGFADDHVHAISDSLGNVYVAVKTGYDTPGQTIIGLLKRNNQGSWDPIYNVDTVGGTRPTVVIDESRDTLMVAYTDDLLNSDNIVYRTSSLETISFGAESILATGTFNNVTTTKQRVSNGVIPFLFNDDPTTSVSSTLVTLTGPTTSPVHQNIPFDVLPRLAQTPLNNLGTTSDSGQVNQSKSWKLANRWWTVQTDASGTWVYRLDGTTWTQVYRLSTSTTAQVDVRAQGNVTHVLIFDGANNSAVASIELVPGATPTYQAWSAKPGLAAVFFTANTKTATLEIDAAERLWIAYDGNSNLFVQYANPDTNYATYSSPIILAGGVTNDDIITISRVGDAGLGVMWSNQNLNKFGFRYHDPSADPTVWGADEEPGQVSNVNVGEGIAASQIHLATTANGRLFAAVGTSFNRSDLTSVGLLVREANGTWSPLRNVDTTGHNAQVVVDPTHNKVVVAYTNSLSAPNNIVYKVSDLTTIQFAGKEQLIQGGFDFVTTTKQKVNGAFPLLATRADNTLAGNLLTIA